jgi:hypothetical protein
MLRRSQPLKNFSMDTILKFGKARDGCAILIPRNDAAASVGGLFHSSTTFSFAFPKARKRLTPIARIDRLTGLFVQVEMGNDPRALPNLNGLAGHELRGVRTGGIIVSKFRFSPGTMCPLTH